MASIIKVTSDDQVNELITKNDRKLVVLYFEASWSNECTSMNPILEQYGKDTAFSNAIIARIDAEKFEALAARHGVEIVPGFVFIKNGKALEKLDGFNPPELNRLTKKCLDISVLPAVKAQTAGVDGNGAAPEDNLENRLRKLISQSPVMVFMKGSPDAPKCGFSRQIVDILRETKCSFGYFDILSDETVRQGLKEFSKWPTYPQVYVGGELVGGLDIMKELKASGELTSTLTAAN